jgi:hypothetical protein
MPGRCDHADPALRPVAPAVDAACFLYEDAGA